MRILRSQRVEAREQRDVASPREPHDSDALSIHARMAREILEGLVNVRQVVARRRRQSPSLEHVYLESRDAVRIQRFCVERTASVEAWRAVDDEQGREQLAIRGRNPEFTDNSSVPFECAVNRNGDLLDRYRLLRGRRRREP